MTIPPRSLERPEDAALRSALAAMRLGSARSEVAPAPSDGPGEAHLVTPFSLSRELGHPDRGARIRRFLRDPDDGGPRWQSTWRLDADEQARVRARFDTSRAAFDRGERHVVELFLEGLSVAAIAARLVVARRSVRGVLRRAHDVAASPPDESRSALGRPSR